MDLKDSIKQIANNIEKLAPNIQTEEATKMSFVLPFLQALGYNVFDPTEVLPEMTCDVGTKKGEKIDYAILRDGEVSILIECKHCSQNLDNHSSQLLRYFGVSSAKFGILTNGIIYRFYTDLDKTNVMDSRPFLEVDMTNIKNSEIEELKKFHKSHFDVGSILSSANELKYLNEFKHLITKEFVEPSPELTRFLSKQIYTGTYTAKVAEQFAAILKKAFSNYISETIASRLNSVIKLEGEPDAEIEQEVETEPANPIVTTQEEMDAFNIVRSILRKDMDVNRIQYKDNKSYFVVNLDSKWKWICRFYLNSQSVKYLSFPLDNYQGEDKIKIETIDDIFNYSDRLLLALTQTLK